MTAWKMLAALAVAMFFGMTLWFSATAVTPVLVTEFHMSPDRAAWLTMAVQAGFVVGTLASAAANLADILNARVLLFLGALAGAATNAAVLVVSSSDSVIALRFLTGASLACVYPPGMKLAAGWFRERRGLALGVVIGALALGNAFPHLLSAIYGRAWREPMLLASALAIVGGLLVLVVVRDGPYVAATGRFDRHAIASVFRSRGARLATFGYLGHMWELYALWTWIAVLASASFAEANVASPARLGAIAAFVTIASGSAGCILAGWLADRAGRARIAMWAMAVSALCAPLTAAAFGRAPLWFFAITVVWGCAVIADSAQFSALVSDYAPPEHVGTALTMQTCLGFVLTIVTIEALPRLADAIGWRWATLLLMPGPVAGLWAMRPFLRQDLKID